MSKRDVIVISTSTGGLKALKTYATKQPWAERFSSVLPFPNRIRTSSSGLAQTIINSTVHADAVYQIGVRFLFGAGARSVGVSNQ